MHKLIYLLPFVIMALSSCMKSSSDVDPIPVPSGTFTGSFRVLLLNKTTNKYDTTQKIPFTMTMSTATGYKVLADTSTVHAGSYGDFSLNGTVVYFTDKTYPKSGTPSKIHLAGGPYAYVYDGTTFNFYTAFADTMAYVYLLKKTN